MIKTRTKQQYQQREKKQGEKSQITHFKHELERNREEEDGGGGNGYKDGEKDLKT